MILLLVVVLLFESPAVLAESSRIVGGEIASLGQFPFQAAISIKHSNGLNTFCGGSLINSQWILTAAHCVSESYFARINNITVTLGTTTLEPLDPEAEVFEIEDYQSSVKVHPRYRSLSLANDLALVQLPVPVEFNDFIQPVQLPSTQLSKSTFEIGVFFASGWGRESDSSKSISNKLRYAELSLMNHTKCMMKFLPFLVKNSNLCVDTSEGFSTCNGDSGGPLISKSLNVLVGVTSFGSFRGCESKSPAVFTKISYYLEWILKNSVEDDVDYNYE